MASEASDQSLSLWDEIIAEEEEQNPQNDVVYRRRRKDAANSSKDAVKTQAYCANVNRHRVIGAPVVRVSWKRALSIRGRTSIAAFSCDDYWPGVRKPRRKAKPALPKGKSAQPLNFEKEKAYFEEVDAFELLEESPSPKSYGTWCMGVKNDDPPIPYFSSVLEKSSLLEKWLKSKKMNSVPLSLILENKGPPLESISDDRLDLSIMKTPEKDSVPKHSVLCSLQKKSMIDLMNKYSLERQESLRKGNELSVLVDGVGDNDIVGEIRKLSLTSFMDPFSALLNACGQSSPSTLIDILSKYCEPGKIIKVGEGTYGEAFQAGSIVCKIVPIDGDFLVNGEVQKKSEELLEEVVLSKTLNQLRVHDDTVQNSCRTFIETLESTVCQGPYDASLITAWEDWDAKRGSENDHPKEFPDKQCYVILVLEHGGQDLESFVLLSFDEARSLLIQVTAALAVAETAFEFEHRDLHWGNILLSRKESQRSKYILEGRHIVIQTYGLHASIIDFTLSRINTGEDILYLDLSSDPELFEGPKGDKQAETYRKMKEVTEENWGGSYPKTNVLWLQYLVDILLLKKSFKRTSNDERELRSLKKRLNTYNSSKEALSDPFFKDLFVDANSAI